MSPELAEHKHVVAPRLVCDTLARVLYDMLVLRNWRKEVKRDRQAPGADSHWGDTTLDATLLTLMPAIERVCGRALLPTYAYARLYFRGDALPRHRDRASCQVVATIHLGSSGSAAPPLWFAPRNRVFQQPGDAVVFLGDEIEHWRDPYEGQNFGQLFLNYVFATGERTGLLYDGRHRDFPPLHALVPPGAPSPERAR
jgi:hypothetical protein